MKKIAVYFLAILPFLMMTQVAEAKRFGGGKSFGFQKKVAPKNFNQKKNTPAQAPSSASGKSAAAGAGAAGAAGAAKASGASKWLGPLAGLAAGGLLAAMIFGDGFENFQILDFILLALVAFVLFKLFKHFMGRRSQTAYAGDVRYEQAQPQHQPAADTYQQREAAPQPAQAPAQPAYDGSNLVIGSGVSESAHPVSEAPAWFNEAEFVEGAKSHFMTLQKAWDNLDLAEIQTYCTPELFAALEQEMQGMQKGENVTIVEELNSETAAMAIDGEDFVVSVRFSGWIQEGQNEDAHAFSEIWHIRRSADDSGNWLIAGIQQNDEAV